MYEHSAIGLLRAAQAATLADRKNKQVFPLKMLEKPHAALEAIPDRC